MFDLAFMDGNKRFYVEYYEMILQKLNPGGYILADNTLWDGHVLEEPHHTDTQTIRHQAFQRSGGSRYAGREGHSSDA